MGEHSKTVQPVVNLVFRKPSSTSNSIEFLFHHISQKLRNNITVSSFILPRMSTGIGNRLLNTFSLTRFRNEIVHITGDTYYAILGAWYCKRIITIHDLSFLDRTKGLSRKILKLFWVTLPVRYAHKITVVSDATRNALLKEVKVDPDKVVVVSNFVDDIYQPVERVFNSANPRILQVGTDFNKNIINLVASLNNIPCTLVIIGKLDEMQKKQLEKYQIRYINKFSLTLHEIHQEYKNADLLAFVSTVEGFGLPIVEAQSTGLPVITSNCSSMPEVAGQGAVFADPGDVESIREGFIQLINNRKLREEVVSEGFRNAKKYSLEKVAASYNNIYTKLSEELK